MVGVLVCPLPLGVRLPNFKLRFGPVDKPPNMNTTSGGPSYHIISGLTVYFLMFIGPGGHLNTVG